MKSYDCMHAMIAWFLIKRIYTPFFSIHLNNFEKTMRLDEKRWINQLHIIIVVLPK